MIEEGILDRDTVIMACVKYMSEADVADMMHINEMMPEPEEPDWDEYDSDSYDVEAMKTDFANGNFETDSADDYLHANIVQASLQNGQFKQAQEQCSRFGLDYREELSLFNGEAVLS